MYLIKIGKWIKQVEKLELVMDLDFNGEQMIQIKRNNNYYKIINAMNGWGNNNMDMFLDTTVRLFVETTL